MAVEIVVPVLGESITSAIVSKWLKQPGEAVSADEAIIELETDKVNVEVPAPISGVVGQHQVSVGDEVSVGALLVTIGAAESGTPNNNAPPPVVEEKKDTSVSNDAEYDLVVIGAGPGGYVAAIRAAQLGMKVACVEKRKTLGGTCLNVGCIPSKALLYASEQYEAAQKRFKSLGVLVKDVQLDLAAMQAHKDSVINANVSGIEFLLKKNKITWLKGTATIPAPGQVSIDGEVVTTRSIVIATGSESVSLPNVEIDEKQVVTSTGALSLEKVPEHMVVIGGGVIGVELGSVWHRLGAKVTIVEYFDRLLPGFDKEVSLNFAKILEKQGIQLKLAHKVEKLEKNSSESQVIISNVAGDHTETLYADVVLVSVGRRPVTQGLGLENIGVVLDEKGRIKTNEQFQTNISGIYAIGDVIAGPMLAHKAEEEGVAVAEYLAGQKPHIDYGLIPGVVYTEPEIAMVGKTEETLKAESIEYTVGKFPFSANGRARAMNQTEGFVKILADKRTNKVLGVHLIGPHCSEMIAEAVLAMNFGASAEDIALTCHAHPTLTESIKEAALGTQKRSIHM
ncbi:Biotin carboxyl carrier protein (AccB) (PDB:1A6X) [Commensalibacter communis]|uniref:Dihydrolipoyl dehydrogenase n=1 Tax=Commensalibacter communis TaxID=2972786 RepID=A0A9W4TPG0_9PROT|nr:dihydrolipoyl dehydrogenase [Commensalibacter communis]CAI3938665.1 Biotin carboxyl carrier protein (AccB) (PDB:1A6X) [Commensalibacter communis]CAI3941686.1 Biotin carboxyl carrier protein (AccB) (PDB:1A6X) [Commensalibacter communis]CAI3941803.1 Biotin carboxyl carrier protein (AccB) (PDB:1A6X) [Commensalibacter communis]CAI3947994.1 Biotin carboxyl carrier protein (AccB) (PDB:1A6X) [Commensalibacter communis]